MKNILLIAKCLLIILLFTQCEKEDMYDHFSPEILYKREVISDAGTSGWEVSPDAKEITLEDGNTTWTIRARVSSPNQLTEIRLIRVDNGEQVLETYNDFLLNTTQQEIEYTLPAITETTSIRLLAIDKRGKSTTRDFTIRVTK